MRIPTAIAIACALTASAHSADRKPTPSAKKAAPAKDQNPDAQKLHDEALALFQNGDLETAAAGFQKVLDLEPGNAPALLNLALVEQRLKRYTSAEGHLTRIIQSDPKNGPAWLILGIIAYEQEKLDAALAHLAQAVLYAPKNVQAHQYFGVVLGRRGWYSAAEEELRRAIELDPKFADAHYNLAVLYMERVPPSIELARRHYAESLKHGAPPDADLAKKLGD